MLTVVRVSPPPNHGEQLTGPEVMTDAAITADPPTDRIAETKAVGP
jgi:hypothetical protein